MLETHSAPNARGATATRDWRHETPALRQLAVQVALGLRPPDVWFRGGTVLNVYTGQWERAEVWVAGPRIAYVGPDEPVPGPNTRVIDCSGRYLVPGYLEIHAHPFQLYSPRALGAAIAPRGTTTLVSDTLLLGQILGRRLVAALDAGLVAPVRDLWGLRVAPQTVTRERAAFARPSPAVRAAAGGPGGAGASGSAGGGRRAAEAGDPAQVPPPSSARGAADDGAPAQDAAPAGAVDFAAAYGMTPEEGIALLHHPRVVEVFEWTSWAGTLRRGEPLPAVLAAGLRLGLPVDGHAPGASARTLAALAAAGVGDCHESIRPEEVLDRVRAGLFAILRHSSLRPDLPELIAAAREAFARGFGHRLALTTDGPTPAMVQEGFIDLALRIVMDGGLEPAQAYQMVTVNPAAYLGLDRYLGAVAPGRLADLNLLARPDDPVPVEVWIDGRPVAREGRLLEEPAPLDWTALGMGPRRLEVRAEAVVRAVRVPHREPGEREPGRRAAEERDLGKQNPGALPPAVRQPGGLGTGHRASLPVVRLLNAVITRLEMREVELDATGVPVLPPGDDLLMAALFDPGSGTVTRALVAGFGAGVQGLASTYTMSGGMLVLGRDPEAMARAAQGAAGGGIVLVEGERVLFHLPLPLGGFLSDLDVPQLARRCRELAALLRERGHPFHDPIYTLLFLSADHLPGPRLTPAGLWDVKGHRLLVPAEKVAGIGPAAGWRDASG
ncbi:Adenine deaminase [Thermaerobacter marianensis DSM 12885]|uniref:adenine deaminase n=1 Tax=Thermaerobacter marianensis (strain ATCC 700841 / DSM 12885 / JCM 10246 / 7p75a) TaxID=644966 RepID=E6SMA4_THEM7|nr:adenine deaminase C-terminal domain-containing protein [Thermaerobacter marianensis]ADU51463.1 Adenine deaminase [Thermaerobacter marianensis DSM 12885]